MLNTPSLEQWSEDMDYSITPVLLLLEKKYERSRGGSLYMIGKKPWSYPKGWRGKVVHILHLKAGGETDGA